MLPLHAPDALDAEKMLVNPGGKSASHIRPTSHPWRPNQRRRRIICYPEAGCKNCEQHIMAFMQDPNFQTIGFKGLNPVLAERGIHLGKDQAEAIAALQTCDDFSPRKAYDNLSTYHQYDERERSYIACLESSSMQNWHTLSDSGCG